MRIYSLLQKKLSGYAFLGLVILLAGVIAVSLPRTATSTAASSQDPAAPAPAFRQISLATNDLIYDPVSQQIYASVPGSAGGIANTITKIDPVTGSVGASVAIGSEPGKLAISDNSQYIYVVLNGAAAVRRFDVTTQSAGLQFSVGSDGSGTFSPNDVSVMPGQPNTVAVARRQGSTPVGVAIFDNGTARPVTTPSGPQIANNFIEFSANASTLYGYTNASGTFSFSKMAVNASGVSVVASVEDLIEGFGSNVVYENGLVFSTSGQVVEPESLTLAGTFPNSSGSSVLPDSSVNQVYFLTGSGASTVLKSYDRSTFLQTGSLAIPTVSGTPGSLIKWGPGNLAFRTSGNQIFFVTTAEIVPVAAAPIPSPTELPSGVTQLPLKTNDLIYDSNTQKIYASVPSSAGSFGNSIAPINPQTGAVETPVFVGSEPRKLAIADSGQQIYVSLDGAAAVRKFDTVTQTPGLQFPLGNSSSGPLYVDDMAFLPGSTTSIAVSRKKVSVSPRHQGVAIYDGAVKRPATTPTHTGPTAIEFSSSASTLYGFDKETSSFGFYKMTVDASGVAITAIVASNLFTGYNIDFSFDSGRVYTTNGKVIDPVTDATIGTFTEGAGPVLADPVAGRVYFMDGSLLRVFDSNTFLPIGSLTIGLTSLPTSLIKAGANTIAFRTDENVFLVSTSDIVLNPPTSFPEPVQVAAGILRLPLITRDLVYDSNTQRVYASLPGNAGNFGNSIAAINPESGTMAAPVFVGSEPGKVAISGNNQFIYTGLDGAAAVRRFDIASQSPGLQFSLGSSPQTGPYTVEDLAVLPGDANAVAVSRRNSGFSPRHEGVAVYDSGVARPNVTTVFSGISNVIEFSSSASTLYGYENETSGFGFRKMAVNANGVSITSNTAGLVSGFNADIRYDNNRVYSSTGKAIDPNTATIVGTFAGVNTLAFVPDSTINRIFFVTGNGSSATVKAFDLTTFQPAGSMTVPGVTNAPRNLVRWGTNGLAFRTSAGDVYFVRTSLVSGAPNLLVNSLSDTADSAVGDGHCDTDGNLGNGDQCTLRAAIQEANAAATDDAITFDVSLNGGTISLNTALDAINKNITITGPGASLLNVQRSLVGGTPDFRIFTINSGKTVSISGLTVSNGRVSSMNGAGISNSGSLTLNDVTVSGNTIVGSGGGGGILNLATLTVNNCQISGNLGSGILSSSFGANTSATINNSVISGNGGSGVANNGANSIATMVINNTTISGNSANGGGGGISNGAGSFTSRAFLTVNNSTISGNTAGAGGGGGGGGGLYNAAVFGNAATVATINNSTISGNVDASPSSGGGGIMSFGNSGGDTTLTVNSCTVFGNSSNAGNGGGIVSSNQGGPTILNLRNTIVAGNLRSGGSINSDVAGTVDSGSFNLIGDGTEMTGLSNSANGNQVGTAVAPINPRLGPLANNGGPTQTHRLLISSPALDAATNVALTTLSGAIDNLQTTVNVTDANSIPAGVGFVVVIDSEQLNVVSKATNTLTVVRGVNGTTAAAHANGANLYAALDQRGAGFLRKRDSADADTVATVDIGAFEAQATSEDISDKTIAEDASLSFGFNVGDAAAITSVTAFTDNPTLVPNDPANISVTGSGSTRTLNITPGADRSGVAMVTVIVVAGSEIFSDTFVLTVTPIADTPSVTNATSNEDSQTFSGLVITRNPADGAEVSHYKITGISNGALFQHNGITPINNGDFILASEGSAGLRFIPAANFFGTGSFNIQASVGNTDAGLGGGVITASITVSPVADPPTVTNATTTINSQTSSGLVVTPNAIDGAEVTHFRFDNIQNGTLFKNDGVTQINNFSLITIAEGAAGLKFTPALNLFSPGTTFSFQVRGATSSIGNGLSGPATATIMVNCSATSEVTNTNDSGAGSLRDAINGACPGATTTFNIPTSDPGFSGGVYTITLTSGQLTIGKNLTINGLGANVLTVKRSTAGGTPRFRVLTVNSGATVTLSGLTISNGHTTDGVTGPGTVTGGLGGGISNSGALTLANVIVSGNRTGIGSPSDLGAAGGNGGGIHNTGTLTLNSSTVSGNTTGVGGSGGQGGHGAGVYNSNTGTLALNDSTISANQTGNGGPGSTGGYGGGIFSIGPTLTLTNSTVSGNTTGNGGMVAGQGGGISTGGTVTLTNSTVTGNHTGDGGNGHGAGIASSGTLTITGSTVSNNVTGTNGGGAGIYIVDGTLALTSSTVSGNQTTGGGGGVNSFKPVTIVNCSITGNTSSTGGGLLIDSISPSIVTNTTISGNNSTGIGGGMWAAGSIVLTNLTIYNNRSDSDNSGDEQGGGLYPQGQLTINNSIVARNFRGSIPNASADDITAALDPASSYNLIGIGGSGNLPNGVNHNQVEVADPRLGPLANNGGPTQTQALLPGSPALDAGNNALVANPPFSGPPFTDQRGTGFARIVDGPDADTTDTVDIGAFEAQVSLSDLANQTINEDGSLSLPFNVGGAANITGVTAASSDTTLVPNNAANISISGSGLTRTLTINPSANAFGTSTITVTVNGNNSQTMTDTFVLTVNSVNDAPSFTKGADQTANENDGTHIINNWASNISAGPDIGQSLNFAMVGNSNPALFQDLPQVSPTGLLTYTPAAGASGTAFITIALMDDGGTANGGIDTSATQSFNINVLEGGALQFSSATFSTAENGGSTVVTVTRAGGTAGEARVNYATSNGTATAGQDYTATSGTLMFADGVTSRAFSVAIANDETFEPDETINLTLTSPAGTGSLGSPASAVLTITNDDPLPTISIGDRTVTEGDSGTVTATFNVALSRATAQTVTVNFATANGTATAGSDYQATTGTLTFLPLETVKQVSVTVNGDNSFEPNETFVVDLSGAVNAGIADNQGAGTITNDDAQGGFISFSQANYTVGESGGLVTITVNRTNDLSGPATVDYATADDVTVVPCSTANSIASSRCDFTTALGTLRFAAGESSKTFVVLISQDNYVEGPETLTITLSNLTGGAALATPSTATLTITDDASEPSANPIDSADAFVRQHYHDFLNREADAAGLAFWTNQITECQQPGATCSAEVRRINVSAAFFLSIEFQETGYFVYRTYKSSYGNIPGTPVPLRLNEFLPDTQQIGKGFVVGAPGADQVLENNKVAYMQDFVARARFTTAYPISLTPSQFVDALFANAGVTPSATDRNAAIAEFNGAGDTSDVAARARALRRVAENSTLKTQETNRAFVLMQYFGYLRRNPNDAPEANLDFGGYNFWLGKLNQFNGNFVEAEMVKAFIVSGEYRQRFGQ